MQTSPTNEFKHDPSSLACPQPIDLTIEMMLKYPLKPDEVERYISLLSPTKPSKPYAFIYGHGLWNDLDVQATNNWIDDLEKATLKNASYLQDAKIWPRLLVTPNAAGVRKPDQFLLLQGDKQLQLFEMSMGQEAAKRGIDHMGTWNMSIQSEKYDGVHLDLKGNLIKAMGVVNWLAHVDSEAW